MEFKIFYSDLNEDAQKRLLEAMGIEEPKDANMDIDVVPLAVFYTEEVA